MSHHPKGIDYKVFLHILRPELPDKQLDQLIALAKTPDVELPLWRAARTTAPPTSADRGAV